MSPRPGRAIPAPKGAGDAESGEDALAASLLLAWYDRHARTLPWRTGPKARARGERPDPYRVWLSEIMLQQTGVKAVAPYFHDFTARWPDFAALAAAPEAEIMAAWAGLGYYSRARNLVACARHVAGEHAGRLPESAAALAELPGIGPYTAAAIAAIAFGEPVPAVDGNVERVVTRLFAIDTPMPAGKADVREALRPLMPQSRPGEFTEALMDLGATICTPKRPACALCPLDAICAARARGEQGAFPVKAKKRARAKKFAAAFVALRPAGRGPAGSGPAARNGQILLSRRPPKGLLGGMAEIPNSDWVTEAVTGMPKPPLAAPWEKRGGEVTHIFTHIELRMTVWAAELPADAKAPPGFWWHDLSDLKGAGLPSLMLKVVEAALPGSSRGARLGG
ncbi:A/G-specific adenine glycosylase [Afifella sp. IM 167]|uniref:A/G-specific adenine glycosylase n=1 Tax=Afifella sp. IM 167 TaxID=2033586 RepID=UPI001CC96987|nr:A/G-specific adenine glycosylase [Afifella sp. IM 167]MBZ8133352.1 A/G-specific adenine glycosylase [Afifella sp. IM 167]